MRENYKVYKLLEVIEMPKDTKVHMINGKDYKINDKGELVPEHGEKLPISKNNIDTYEFTIIEELKNYNFRVYKNGISIRCFNRSNLSERDVNLLLDGLLNQYNETVSLGITGLDTAYLMPKYNIDVQIEEIVENI